MDDIWESLKVQTEGLEELPKKLNCGWFTNLKLGDRLVNFDLGFGGLFGCLDGGYLILHKWRRGVDSQVMLAHLSSLSAAPVKRKASQESVETLSKDC